MLVAGELPSARAFTSAGADQLTIAPSGRLSTRKRSASPARAWSGASTAVITGVLDDSPQAETLRSAANTMLLRARIGILLLPAGSRTQRACPLVFVGPNRGP